ncbi:MAG: Polyribonucleotide nucleotidyltransferase [Parcubacteria group bacterium GW2011_GWA2_42_11]|nr:MAG: Polyribonucleotide nucleotidyltransferase [Parcubacteria group bacterium GW2011_GWA2_42_11]
MEKKIYSRQFAGRTLTVETGRLAQQANGSVLVSFGETVLLATAVMSSRTKNVNYMPLTVEYEERLYAAGKIKGSRFIKREGRPQDDAILSGRMIDRTLRPRFNHDIRNEIQVVVTVMSFDRENDPDVLGIFAASLALSISDIPFAGPVAAVRIGQINNEFVINPTFDQRNQSEFDLIVSGTQDKINMMEAGAKETPEKTIVQAVECGFAAYQELIAFQQEIIADLAPAKRELKIAAPTAEFVEKINDFLTNKLEEAIYIKDRSGRQNRLGEITVELNELIKLTEPEETDQKINFANNILESEINRLVHKNILVSDQRPDGRKLNEVRALSGEVGVLPRTHGSALFSRGSTQALSAVTLGAPSEKQIIDGIEAEYKKRFIHHYNFPPFCVGEIGPFRGPGRREIGHGALAERTLLMLIPPEEKFPYTIRVVSEILSSNGSSSMASVCGSSLALMDAGVPMKAPAAGIAMGLIMDENGKNYKILTDIQGPEDHHGDMDMKVAGTQTGVCGMQMDVKIEGIDIKIVEETLAQAKEARLHILEKLNAVLATPRPELSEHAPRIITLQINPDKIREVIGPGGKIINKIIDETGAKIDIEDSGIIFITSDNEAGAQQAVEWIKNITHEVTAEEIFTGKVTRLLNFGAFVEILPGQEGLIHISELADYRVNRVEDIVKIGDTVTVKVKEIDDMGRINLTMRNIK